MPPRRRRYALVPDQVPRAQRLSDYTPRAPAPANDLTAGYGWRGWNRPSEPLTASQKTQLIGGVGTMIFAGLIQDQQYNISLPDAWSDQERWKTIARMEADGQATAILNVCVLPLLQATYSLNPASESDADVQVAQDVSDNLLNGLQGGWTWFLRKFYRNRFRYGHFLGEKVWTTNAGTTLLRKIAERPPQTIYRWFPSDDDELDRVMQRVWILDESGVTGQWKFPVIPAEKLVISTRNQEANDYRGVSLFYHMWEHWDFKHKLYIIDGIAAERNGMGVPTLEDPPIVRQQSDRDIAAAALEAFRVGEHAWIDLPNGYKLTLTGVSGGVRDIMPSIQHHDLLMARSALAHFINLDAYGQVLISEESQSLFLMAEEAEANEFTDAINLVIREWCDYNYEAIDRYPTIAVTQISGERDLDQVLRGIAQLMTAKALTYNVETENALRDDLGLPDLPAEATPAGGGAPSVDTDSQGATAATVSDPTVKPAPGETAEQDLARKPAFSAGRLGPRAIHLSGKPLRRGAFRVHMSGAYRLADTRPGNLVNWVLGDGGASGTHCPECVELAAGSPYEVTKLAQKPGDGKTYCGFNCTCRLEAASPSSKQPTAGVR